MKIELLTFGKDNKRYLDEGINLYIERIQRYCSFEMKILSAGKKKGKASPDVQKKQEAEVVDRLLSPDRTLITLDEKGKSITSVGLSELLAAQQMNSGKIVTFLIGGAYGIDDRILKKSERIISLSALTFPHQIVRLIMVEQIYRAFSILQNSPYHHL